MLSKPKNGWCEIEIHDFKAIGGYLVDIPFEWLTSCLFGLNEKKPISLFIDEEGSECFITSYFDVTHIIVDREEEVKCFTFREIDFMDVTSWILEDIECNFEEWVKWSPYEDTDLDYANRRIRLRKLIDEVKEALERERGRGQV